MSEFAAALAKAQAEMKNASLNKVNPHFKSKYADLPGIRDAVLPILNKHGFAVVQTTRVVDGALMLVTKLIHATGEIEGEYPLPIAKPQEMGSAITYARRYTLAALACIAADEDDDGEAAKDMTAKAPQKPVKAVQQVKRDGPIFRLQDAIWNATGVYSETAEQSFAEIGQFGAQRAVEALAEFDRTMAEIKESADMKSLTETGRKQLRDLARDIRTAIQSRVQLHEAAA